MRFRDAPSTHLLLSTRQYSAILLVLVIGRITRFDCQSTRYLRVFSWSHNYSLFTGDSDDDCIFQENSQPLFTEVQNENEFKRNAYIDNSNGNYFNLFKEPLVLSVIL